jgi:hypothetical protein
MAKHLARLAKTIVDERRIRNFQPTQPKMWVRTRDKSRGYISAIQNNTRYGIRLRRINAPGGALNWLAAQVTILWPFRGSQLETPYVVSYHKKGHAAAWPSMNS